MNKDDHEFLPELFVRAPFYSYEKFSLNELPAVLQEGYFRNAIWLASPVFYGRLAAKNFNFEELDAKERFTLAKYFNRMCYRPTPFGSFASFSLVSYGQGASLELCSEKDSLLHLLPDISLSGNLPASPVPFSDNTPVIRNPTLYRSGAYYRFISALIGPKKRFQFSVDQVDAAQFNTDLLKLFKVRPQTAGQLVQWIMDNAGCPAEEARDYLRFLLEDQVLYTPAQGYIIEPAEHNGAAYGLRTLKLGDADGLAARSGAVAAAAPGAAVHYAALERPVLAGSFPEAWLPELNAAIRVLHKLAVPVVHGALKKFITGFQARFDKEKVPLLALLDPDTGITYGDRYYTGPQAGLLDGIPFPAPPREAQPLEWERVRPLLLQRWLDNKEQAPGAPLELDESMFDGLPGPGLSLPPSLAMMFRTAGRGLQIEQVSGASAVQLIGRFTMFSPEVQALARQVTGREVAAEPDVIFVDVGQLSDAYVDNINRRKAAYPYELPVNTFSRRPPGEQLQLSDILASVRDGELVLESISLGKRVVPRLASVYNYHHNELPLFRLLGDLQFQGIQSNLTLDLARLFPGLEHYPRVTLGKVVLAAAKWYIGAAELAELKAGGLTALGQLRQRRSLPAHVAFGDHDQQLVFDLQAPDSAAFFLDCLQKRDGAVLHEYLLPDRSLQAGGQPLAGQYITFFHNGQSVYRSLVPQPHRRGRQARRFPPGSDWLYVKLYVSPASANTLLETAILPVVRKYRTRISTWFFIRYADPEPHLRLRIRAQGPDAGQLLIAIHAQVKKSKAGHLVKDIVCDTYQRELERYGARYIEKVEALFCAGSGLVATFLAAGYGELELAIRTVHGMVGAFYEGAGARLAFAQSMADSYLSEFQAGKKARAALDTKYRGLRADMARWLEGGGMPPGAPGHCLAAFLAQAGQIRDVMRGETPRVQQVMLADLAHMQVNRSFRSDQRKQELFTYYCLSKYYASALAREGGH